MGRQLHEGNPLEVWTNKPVKRLLHNIVWVIVGEGTGARRFSLGSVFQVGETGDSAEAGFKHFARGAGHVFQPAIALNALPWFPEFAKRAGSFGFGLVEIKQEAVIRELEGLALAAGFDAGRGG